MHGKENRSLQNIVGLALVCTKDGGIPLFYDVYSGNLQDATVFQNDLPAILQHVNEVPLKSAEITLTFDKGINSQPVFDLLDQSQTLFIASIRPSMVKDLCALSADQFTLYTLPNKKQVGIKEFKYKLYGKERRLIAVHNSEQAKWNGNTLYAKLNADIAAIQDYFRKRLNQKMWRKADTVEQKIQKLVKSQAHIAFLKIQLSGEDGNLTLAVTLNHEAINAHIATLAKSFLLTNHPESTSAVDIAWMFRQQITIERAFSYLKCPEFCASRPMNVSNDESIQGHLFSCVLGLLLLTLTVREINQKDPSASIEAIRHELGKITAVSVKYQGQGKPLIQLAQMTPEAQKYLEALQIATLM